jgi:hypothetical protein
VLSRTEDDVMLDTVELKEENDVEVAELESVELVQLLHLPKSGLQPVPQYACDDPQKPYSEQQSPKPEPMQPKPLDGPQRPLGLTAVGVAAGVLVVGDAVMVGMLEADELAVPQIPNAGLQPTPQ